MAAKEESIRKACIITDEIFSVILKSIKSMKTERDIDRLIRSQARQRKLKLAFPPIAASGKNAAEIHHKPSNSKIRNGFLVIDFGVKVNGFCSDMTRTLHIGKAGKEEKEMYKKLLEVQKAALKKAVPGAECFDIECFARKRLGRLREFFTHSLGHGVGLKVHEKPSLSIRSAEILKKGDIVTIEPGIYIKGKSGLRIEDTILVGKKPEQLTKSPKNLIEIV